uniref:A-kinase anchor protein 7-like phosphoesterase domain-containing protein n=1 Tax=Periophthalmus magnuspinnatus TaxID=409849 RepID=A0A3B3ZA32_9GOBI
IGERADSEEDTSKKKKKKESKRPNYFLSIRITNPQVRLIAGFQIAEYEKHDALGILFMCTLPFRAATVLAAVEPSLAELLGGQSLVLPFSGIGHFRKEVVFIGLAPGEHRHTLHSLAELLRSRFEEQGLLQGDCRGFEPHLTIMKLSRASKLKGIKRVDPSLYSNYSERFFGDQPVERVDLCSMLKKKQQDGYYYTETSLKRVLFMSCPCVFRLVAGVKSHWQVTVYLLLFPPTTQR